MKQHGQTILSPAKINLHLRIGPPAADGFHPLLSWMCTVGHFDELTFHASNLPGIHLYCDDPAIPSDRTNLILRAADALAQAASITPPATDITLHKRIATGGGLGGGSSNAATTLLALNQFWNLHWPIERLAAIGEKLGSDVPFFFHGPSSVCTGRGQFVRPIARPAVDSAILIFPDFPMPTPAVYRRFDEMRLGSTEAVTIQPDWDRWTKMAAEDLLPQLVNDLEAPAFDLNPKLGELRRDLEQSLGRIVRMSGSGSTLFTLADAADAEWLSHRLQQQNHRYGVFALGMSGTRNSS